jgi:hypothetical protein
MSGSFSGTISLEDKQLKPKTHGPIEPDAADMRVNVLQEYISKVPNATVQNLKNALNHFSKFNEEEFRNLVKTANSDKYNELYVNKEISTNYEQPSHVYTDIISQRSILKDYEVEFIQKYPNLGGGELYRLYKQFFPNSERNPRFIRDFRNHRNIHEAKTMRHIALPDNNKYTNQQLVAQTIRSLYKAGFTPDMLPKVKPVINELLAQNSNRNEIEFAIAYLKN